MSDEDKGEDDSSSTMHGKNGQKRQHSMDKKAKGRFKKLFGLSKPNVQVIKPYDLT